MMTLTNKKELIYSRVQSLFDELHQRYGCDAFIDAFGDAIGMFYDECGSIIEQHEQSLIESGAASYAMEADTGFKYIKYNQQITNEV